MARKVETALPMPAFRFSLSDDETTEIRMIAADVKASGLDVRKGDLVSLMFRTDIGKAILSVLAPAFVRAAIRKGYDVGMHETRGVRSNMWRTFLASAALTFPGMLDATLSDMVEINTSKLQDLASPAKRDRVAMRIASIRSRVSELLNEAFKATETETETGGETETETETEGPATLADGLNMLGNAINILRANGKSDADISAAVAEILAATVKAAA